MSERCPVCEGRGEVPAGFYPSAPTSTGAQTCRTCGGRGMVIAESSASSPPADDPRDLTFRG